jgi:glycosyltransferase involved in cell wall biosynthesis
MLKKHKKQKVILQLRSSSGFFGAENVVIELAKQLSNSNYHPIVGVFEDSRNPHIELAQVAESHNLETKIFKCSGQFDLRIVFAIRNFINQRSIDIIHSHGYKANFYSLLATLFNNVKFIATCHPWIKTNLALKFYSWFDKSLLKKSDHVVAISDEIKDAVLENGVARNKISVIENGIDVSRFNIEYDRNELVKEFDITPGNKVIGTIGRLSEEKGQKNFIDAAKTLREKFENLVFMIVGDGPLLDELRTQVSRLDLQDYFIFTGVSENIPKVLALMDIFVLPSLTEGLPMVLLEAMAAKKPIVATDVGAIPRLVLDKKSGCLVKPHDSNALIKAITFLLNNKDERNKMAQRGHEIAVTKYSSEEMAKKYIKIFDQLCNYN